MEKLNEKMEKIRNIFYNIDFNEFENIILFSLQKTNDLDKIKEIIIQYYNINSKKLYYNYLDFDIIDNLIKDYIEAYYTLNIRNQYVYSKTYFYSHITNKSNLIYDLESQKINEAYKNRTYSIHDNFVELHDEASDDIDASKNQDVSKDNSGALEYRRKYGHLHKETNYLISTKQEAANEIARYRRLNQSNIYIEKNVEIIYIYKLINKIIKRIIKIIDKINYIKFNIQAILKNKIFYDKRIEYINRKMKGKLKFRKIKNFLVYVQKFLFSQNYCYFKIRNYSNDSDVGKINNESKKYYDEFNYIIPLKYCFGCFNTHEYSYIQDELIKNSKVNIEDIQNELMFINKKHFKKDTVLGGDFGFD